MSTGRGYGRLMMSTLVVLAFCGYALPAALAGDYTITDLGVVAGKTASFGNAVAAGGLTAGMSQQFGGNARVAFRNLGSGMTAIPSLVVNGESGANGINASGSVVGWATAATGSSVAHAFFYDGSMTDLGTLGGKGASGASAINDSGVIVGGALTHSGTQHAFSYFNRRMTDLGTLSGTIGSNALAVNALGQAVGEAWDSSGNHRAFLYDSTGIRDIGTLGGSQARAHAINKNGSIAGDASDSGGSWHAFLYTSGLMVNLGGLNGAGSAAYGINDWGDVVGSSGGHAFVYTDGAMTDLNTLIPAGSGWVLTDANGITNNGQIVGDGTINGQQHAYLFAPTLLRRWRPQLRLDTNEAYFPDSPAEITDNYSAGQWTNRLQDGNLGSIAASDPGDSSDSLTIDYIGSFYTTSNGLLAAQDVDRIDEHDDYELDAYNLHQNSGYANRIYGRTIPIANGETILQYWFFYYYNQHSFGDHEGDWEMAQVHLDASGNPIRVTNAQHNGGERCDWIHVQRTTSGHPILYVAAGSHASYFSSGTHYWDAGAVIDDVDGAVTINPTLVPIDAPVPNWLSWPGHWGGSGSSPPGPAMHDSQWNHALDWENGVSGCSEGQTYAMNRRTSAPADVPAGKVAPAPAPVPKLSVSHVGNTVRVNYEFAAPRTQRERPWQILFSVRTSAPKSPALGRWIELRGLRGTITQDVSVLHGRMRVFVTVFTRDGGRTRVSLPVQP
jgi:probable HAF family extracellular repeat protein